MTRADRILRRFQNNKLVAIVIVVAVVVIALAKFTDAIERLAALFSHPSTVQSSPGSGDQNKILTTTASIWKVDLDTKGALVASKELSGTRGGDVSAATLRELTDWISSELGLEERKGAKNVRVKVLIPADPGSRKPLVQRIPDGPMEVLLWDLRGGGKSRLPIDWETVKQMKEEYQLEIRVPGSAATVIDVIPGEALDKEVELEPDSVGIGVEKFTGLGEGVSERLCQELRAKSLIKVVNPAMMETIRAKVERDNEAIRKNPAIQMRLRSLGVDYVISGNVRSESR